MSEVSDVNITKTIFDQANEATEELIPSRSRHRYECEYNKLQEWMKTMFTLSQRRSAIELTRRVGIHFPDNEKVTKTNKIMFTINNTLILLFTVWKLTCSLLCIVFNDIEGKMIAETVGILQLTGLTLMVFYYFSRKQIERLFSNMDEISSRITANVMEDGFDFPAHYGQILHTLSRFHRMLFTSSAILPFIYCFTTPSVFTKRILPVPIYCSFEISYSALFEIFLFFQALGSALPQLQKLGNEFILFGIMCVHSKYCQYLTQSIKGIEKLMQSEPRDATRKRLIVWIQIHQKVVRNIQELHALYSPIVVFYILLIISMTASGLFYQLNGKNVNIIQASTLGGFLMTAIVQYYVLCHMANELSDQAEKISNAVYSFPWYEADKTIADMVRLIITMANQPLHMCAYRTESFIVSKEAFSTFAFNLVSAYMGFARIKEME